MADNRSPSGVSSSVRSVSAKHEGNLPDELSECAAQRLAMVMFPPAEDDKRVFQVQLTNGSRTAQTPFVTVEGPNDRWFVESAELDPVKEFCRNPPQG